MSILANFLANKTLGINLTDFTNGFRFYSERSVKKITKKCGKISDGFILLSEIIVVLDSFSYNIDEIHTTFINREKGKSNVGINLIIDSFIGLIKLASNKKKYQSN